MRVVHQHRSPSWHQTPLHEVEQCYQPIETLFRPSPSKSEAIDVKRFIELLRIQEEYYTPEVIAKNPALLALYPSQPMTQEEVWGNTKLMITLMRKVFYDYYGWNSQLIRGTANIPGRYGETLHLNEDYWIKIVGFQPLGNLWPLKTNARDRERRVIFQKDDPEYDPQDPNKEPEIYANDNQEVTLMGPEGKNWYCDLGHTLDGLDAANYPQPVTPMPNFLFFLKWLFPYMDRNIDAVCWLGDVASSAGETLYLYSKQAKNLSKHDQQELIEMMAPGSDMMGNIDGLVIPLCYDVAKTQGGKLPSEIFADYYLNPENPFVQNRFSLFCMAVGIEWDKQTGEFLNWEAWLKRYKTQLRDGTVLYMLSRGGRLGRFVQAFFSWIGCTDKVIKPTYFLEILYKALQPLVVREVQAKAWSLLSENEIALINQRLAWMNAVEPMQPTNKEEL